MNSRATPSRYPWMLSAALLIATAGCEQRPADETPRSAARAPVPMTERLVRLADAAAPLDNPALNDARAALLLEQVRNETDDRKRLLLAMSLGVEYLRSGETENAIRQFEHLRSAFIGAGVAPEHSNVRAIDELLGICQLRLGEQDNCLAHHDTDSCLMPIKGSGVHIELRGSIAARDRYASLLERFPEDLRYRWLFNLTHMTLGTWPAQVPTRWRIDPEVFASDVELPRFYDVATPAGLAVVGLSGGVVMDDLDGDGRLDVLASAWGQRDPLRYLHNEGDGTFADRTHAAGLDGIVGGLNLVHADYD